MKKKGDIDSLLHCPFCGSKDLRIEESQTRDKTITWYKILHGCAVPCGVSLLDSNKSKLTKQWNNRETI